MMLLALASTALLLGLTGGAHCLVMCAGPCGALTSSGSSQSSPGQVVQWQRTQGSPHSRVWLRPLAFHVGRLVGYGAAGALAALAMDRLAWLSQLSAALRPAWTMTHVAILAWGLLMVLQAQQPAWIEAVGRRVWAVVRPLASRPGGAFSAGLAWALLPCGLLYTALLMAALSGSVMRGALCMVVFGAGSSVWLLAGPWAWQGLRRRLKGTREAWGVRLAGAVLLTMGAWALWMDVVHGQPAPWCAS